MRLLGLAAWLAVAAGLMEEEMGQVLTGSSFCPIHRAFQPVQKYSSN
jgi:hypothetical protein